MTTNRCYYLIATIATLLLMLLTLTLQPYQLAALEESHIMLYDSDYVGAMLAVPGGFARLLASLCTQFFMIRWAAFIIVALIYVAIIFPLTAIAVRLRVPLWASALSMLPCLCLMLCLENGAYLFFGTTAMMLCVLALWLYVRFTTEGRVLWRVIVGCTLSFCLYYLAGTVVLSFGVAALAYDIAMGRQWSVLSLLYPVIALFTAYFYYLGGVLPTVQHVYTPVMYYDMGSTYFMMIYAMCSLPIYILVVALLRGPCRVQKLWHSVALTVAVVAVEVLAMTQVYGMVHSKSNSRINHERYLARCGRWQDIADLEYDGASTHYTSYRFLALAHLEQLTDRIGQFRPAIAYLFENKPVVRKRDQQVYSDIYYDCCYMAAARHSAFDTDIVTPGAFNPYETQKLAAINIAFGDYAVADKLLSKLEKTLFYRAWAVEHRRFLYDDAAVEADPVLGPMRRAIPVHNDYMSPKGICRDLKYVVDQNPEQQVAAQFYNAFLILTNQLYPNESL